MTRSDTDALWREVHDRLQNGIIHWFQSKQKVSEHSLCLFSVKETPPSAYKLKWDITCPQRHLDIVQHRVDSGENGDLARLDSHR